jgi:hypothetical protein
VAHFDRAIPPGGEGKITLKLNTRGYEGKVRKTARVYTNDPNRQTDTITIEALVKTPILVSPRSVFLQGKMTEMVTKSVDIKGDSAKALKIEPIDFSLNHRVKYTIEEISQGKHYRINFTSIPNVSNHYQGTLRLKTNYPEKPELLIFVRGRFIN